MRLHAIFWLWLCLILPVGCVDPEGDLQTSNEPELVALRQENRKLTRSNDHLQSENIVLKSKLAETIQRERQLSKKVAEMQFELERLEEQVRVLSDVPAERDRYRAEAQACKSRIAELEMEISRLRAHSVSPPQNPRPVGQDHRGGQAE